MRCRWRQRRYTTLQVSINLTDEKLPIDSDPFNAILLSGAQPRKVQ